METAVQETAVVYVTNTLEQCSLTRLHALARATRNSTYDTVLFFDGTYARLLAARSHEMWPSAVRAVLQPQVPAHARSLGDERSGMTKPAFLLWLAGSSYNAAWHVEDDTFFAGAWGVSLFDAHVGHSADLVGQLRSLTLGDNAKYKLHCTLDAAGTRCAPGGNCPHCLTYWPALRVSRRLARATLAVLRAGGRGHHEYMPGAICQQQLLRPSSGAAGQSVGWCTMRQLPSNVTEGIVLGGATHFRQRTSEVTSSSSANRQFTLRGLLRVMKLPLRPGTLYHPIKCQASAFAGRLQLAAVDGSLQQAMALSGFFQISDPHDVPRQRLAQCLHPSTPSVHSVSHCVSLCLAHAVGCTGARAGIPWARRHPATDACGALWCSARRGGAGTHSQGSSQCLHSPKSICDHSSVVSLLDCVCGSGTQSGAPPAATVGLSAARAPCAALWGRPRPANVEAARDVRVGAYGAAARRLGQLLG